MSSLAAMSRPMPASTPVSPIAARPRRRPHGCSPTAGPSRLRRRRAVAARRQRPSSPSRACTAPRIRDGAREVGRACRDDQHVLEVDLAPGMQAAADEIDHRQRDDGPGAAAGPRCVGTAARSVLAAAARQAACDTASMAFAPRRAFVGVPSRSINRPVEARLVVGRETADGRADDVHDVGDRPKDAKTAVSSRIAVAELDGLMRARRRPDGTELRPTIPFASTTSASTVGRPRESRISRATTRSIRTSGTRRDLRHRRSPQALARTVRTRSTSARWSARRVEERLAPELARQSPDRVRRSDTRPETSRRPAQAEARP